MKMLPVAAILFTLVVPNWALADSRTSAAHRGRAKMWIGATLMAAGAVAMPITAPSQEGRFGAGLGLMSAGGALVLWGAHERRQPPRPQTSVRINAGRTLSVQVQRSW